VSTLITSANTKQLQRDLVRRLSNSSADPRRYSGLSGCKAKKCGRQRCSEACWFGNRRQLLQTIPVVYRLLQRAGTAYEVRVIRGVWGRPFGELHEASIAAANKLNRRALDKLCDRNLIAVGTFKASVASEKSEKRWICEIHEIVAGAVDKAELERAFEAKRHTDEIQSLRVEEVNDLAGTIHAVLSYNLQCWKHPFYKLPSHRAKKAQRAEYYRWLSGLRPGARMVRYGCDRYFNELSKRPRFPKPKKKRPYPYWLELYQFGTDSREDIDRDRDRESQQHRVSRRRKAHTTTN
jgi:hypothetical protein